VTKLVTQCSPAVIHSTRRRLEQVHEELKNLTQDIGQEKTKLNEASALVEKAINLLILATMPNN